MAVYEVALRIKQSSTRWCNEGVPLLVEEIMYAWMAWLKEFTQRIAKKCFML